MAVALVTFRHTGQDAEEFWHEVAYDDGLSQGDPRKALHLFLRTTKLGSYEPHVYSRYIAWAWCRAWQDLTCAALRAQVEHLPITIDGTPHDGKGVYRYITPHGEALHDPMKYVAEDWQQGLFKKDDAAAD
jgi:hypothetical protein